MKPETYHRKTIFCEVKSHLHKPGSFVEATAWKNGEGFDAQLDDAHIQISWDQWRYLMHVVFYLENNFE
jgi:hypothetical protein